MEVPFLISVHFATKKAVPESSPLKRGSADERTSMRPLLGFSGGSWNHFRARGRINSLAPKFVAQAEKSVQFEGKGHHFFPKGTPLFREKAHAFLRKRSSHFQRFYNVGHEDNAPKSDVLFVGKRTSLFQQKEHHFLQKKLFPFPEKSVSLFRKNLAQQLPKYWARLRLLKATACRETSTEFVYFVETYCSPLLLQGPKRDRNFFT